MDSFPANSSPSRELNRVLSRQALLLHGMLLVPANDCHRSEVATPSRCFPLRLLGSALQSAVPCAVDNIPFISVFVPCLCSRPVTRLPRGCDGFAGAEHPCRRVVRACSAHFPPAPALAGKEGKNPGFFTADHKGQLFSGTSGTESPEWWGCSESEP